MSDTAARGLRMADLLKSMVARGASDIHLQAGAPPHLRLLLPLPSRSAYRARTMPSGGPRSLRAPAISYAHP